MADIDIVCFLRTDVCCLFCHRDEIFHSLTMIQICLYHEGDVKLSDTSISCFIFHTIEETLAIHGFHAKVERVQGMYGLFHNRVIK